MRLLRTFPSQPMLSNLPSEWVTRSPAQSLYVTIPHRRNLKCFGQDLKIDDIFRHTLQSDAASVGAHATASASSAAYEALASASSVWAHGSASLNSASVPLLPRFLSYRIETDKLDNSYSAATRSALSASSVAARSASASLSSAGVHPTRISASAVSAGNAAQSSASSAAASASSKSVTFREA